MIISSFSLLAVNSHTMKLEREKCSLLRRIQDAPREQHPRLQNELKNLNVQIVQYQLVAAAFTKESK
jgi:hypothetical protein